MSSDDRRNIDHRYTLNIQRGHDLKRAQYPPYLLGNLGLKSTDNHVLAALAAAAALFNHLKRLADAGSVSKKHL
jgi:hypothetical protein